jgi:branched-chain amino acid transport system permease protein
MRPMLARAGPWLACLLPLLCGVVLMMAAPPTYIAKLAVFVGLGTLQAMSLNMIWGYGGQFSMGQMMLVAIGAYVSALCVTALGMSPWLAVFPAFLVAGLVTLVLGALALRLRGFYFSIVTLAFAQILLLVAYNAESLGGPSGMPITYALPDIAIAGVPLLRMDALGTGLFMGILLTALLLAQTALIRSRLGRAIVAVREEEVLARSIGIPPTRNKIAAFLLSSIPAVLAGWLTAPIISYLTPTAFGIDTLLDQICMVVIGGTGTVLGPFAGAVVVVLLPEALRPWGAMRVVGYSVVLILVVIFAPRGLVGIVQRLLPRATPLLRATEDTPLVAAAAIEGPLLEIQGVSKRYAGLVAVADVTLAIGADEAVGLIGPNGAGKTTLFDIASGFTGPTSGTVRWRGAPIRPPERLAGAGLVRTFQHARLFPGLTVRANLLTAAHLPGRGLLGHGGPEDRVARVLRLCHLREWADAPANGLPYGVGKRLGVALGLITEPLLLMLDEPAAGLAAAERQALAAMLERIGRLGVTLLVIEHDVGFVAQVCRRVVVLAAGAVICDGPIDQVRTDPAVIDAYLGTGAPEPHAQPSSPHVSDAAN